MTQIVINCHLLLSCEIVQIANLCTWWTFRFHVGALQSNQGRKSLTQGQLKLTQLDFPILNSNIKVIYLRFIENTYFHVLNLCEKLKVALWLFSSKKTASIKWHLLSKNIPFQNLLKNRNLLPAEKFGTILAFDK